MGRVGSPTLLYIYTHIEIHMNVNRLLIVGFFLQVAFSVVLGRGRPREEILQRQDDVDQAQRTENAAKTSSRRRGSSSSRVGSSSAVSGSVGLGIDIDSVDRDDMQEFEDMCHLIAQSLIH